MSKKNTLEEAYFHICNGGMTLKVVERVDTRMKDVYANRDPAVPEYKGDTWQEPKKIGVQKMTNRRWVLEVKLNTYAASVSFKFPLVPLIVDWLLYALPRVKEEMELVRDEPTDGIEHGFRDTHTARIRAERGGSRDHDWPHERVLVQCGSNEEPQQPVVPTV